MAQKAGEIKQIPPPGVTVSQADQEELEKGVKELAEKIDALRVSLKDNRALLDLLPDVQIYYNAVHYALKYNEFFDSKQPAQAKVLLKEGMARASALSEGKAPWTKATGLIVKGYVSRIDGSVQPYGLQVPPGYEQDPSRPRRLDFWYHGRGETLNEINFLITREQQPGPFTPADTFVLQPYGRYCNANRFAGEVDTFEALDNVRKQYAIDENRIVNRGFSMGGASCWQYATHYPGLWCAANPGAGFTETAHFLHIEDLNSIPWYQRKLWHMYDSTDYALNCFNCLVVAYSGEIDAQRQAANEMDQAMAGVGLQLVQVIGPKTKHAFEPKAKLEVAKLIDELAQRGRPALPREIKFTTWTLKYNRVRWVIVDRLDHQWERATVEANISGPGVTLKTSHVTALTLDFAPGSCPFDLTKGPTITIDDHQLVGPQPLSDKSWEAHLHKIDGVWELANTADDGTLHKRHDLQGPIDDAFMDSFVMVRPTGTPLNEKVGNWTAGEMAHAIDQWRKQFRGEARVKDDTAIDDNDIASSNLVLWGDPSSNAILKKIADRLPIRWDGQQIHVGDKTYPAGTDAAVLIYPNPLNPKRYVVLNSGHTFREFDLMNNARQTPKLPDWAIVDTTTAPSPTAPGGIADAGFFGEKWELMPSQNEKP